MNRKIDPAIVEMAAQIRADVDDVANVGQEAARRHQDFLSERGLALTPTWISMLEAMTGMLDVSMRMTTLFVARIKELEKQLADAQAR
jgi:hypothetical protein